MEVDNKFLKGLFLIFLGVILLVNQLDILPDFIPEPFISVWSLLILLGVYLLLTKSDKTPGLVLIVLGSIFLLQNYYHYISLWKLWPLFIIAAGLGVLFRKKKYLNNAFDAHPKTVNFNAIDEVAIFGGGERVVNSSEFVGGNVTTIFGGSEINLLNATLSPGRNVIEVFSMFGGATFIIPNDWRIKVEVIALFGGFSDKRNLSGPNAQSGSSELIIKGFVLFGGGEIKSFT